jgi:hypothetical protein
MPSSGSILSGWSDPVDLERGNFAGRNGESKHVATNSLAAGMNTVAETLEARAASVRITESELVAVLEDGRTLSVPFSWYPRLVYGTPE